MTSRFRPRAIALAGALVAATLSGSLIEAPRASADGVGFVVPILTISPTSGNTNTDAMFLSSIATNVAAPTRLTPNAIASLSGGTYIFQDDVNRGAIATVRTVSTPPSYGTFGLNGQPGFADRSAVAANDYVSSLELDSPSLGLATGIVELRYYWSASPIAPDVATDPYVQIAINWNAATGAWSVLPPPIDTTVSFTAGSSGSTVTLDAAIKDSATGLVDATAQGTVTLIENGSVIVATVEVVSGHAVLVLTGVPDGLHIYSADYETSNFYTHVGSSSRPAFVFVTANVGEPGISTNVSATILAGAGGGVLTLTGVPTTVALGTATLNAGTLNARGTLNVVVTDSRQLDYPGWSLTGQVGDFISAGATPKVLSGKYLGCTTGVAGGRYSIGTQVLPAPASVDGLKAVSLLASGVPEDIEVNNVLATLQLKAPKNTPAGNYSAVLTLTLI
ncbi:hypothetical protein [Salinibacterium sp.]|uniref:hypothetical protein n=1 Tax=Salinibacterium sp. TaxID=1915057 RepID=UPI00286A9075|nr:hypothetical protein [Salinibacterium sp.]